MSTPVQIPFNNSFAKLPAGFYTKLPATAVKAPKMIAYNQGLAKDLGIIGGSESTLAEIFSGNQMPAGAEPLAQLYSGHQFGQYNPQLGDGRALLLGEVLCPDGARFDIQLKGAGPTPYSRNGDGRSWLGPVLREYVVSEAMHALGVPTTRALAAVETGQPVLREAVYPGGILTRVAKSHLRVGSFQVFAARRDITALQTLFEYTVERHFPQAQSPEALLTAVIDLQARLIAKWMSLGFIHGVMNTDNCQIAGETIDYGPCAFMDIYHPDQVFSSIDRTGRYAYSNQPNIIVWNMAQFATALIPLMPDAEAAIDRFTQNIHAMPDLINTYWLREFGAKIGLKTPQPEDSDLISAFLTLMAEGQADFTNTFHALANGKPENEFTDPHPFEDWRQKWQMRLKDEADPHLLMQSKNPALIPRNHKIEHMITAAVTGDYTQFHRLNAALSSPFTASDDFEDLRQPPEMHEKVTATFCGT